MAVGVTVECFLTGTGKKISRFCDDESRKKVEKVFEKVIVIV